MAPKTGKSKPHNKAKGEKKKKEEKGEYLILYILLFISTLFSGVFFLFGSQETEGKMDIILNFSLFLEFFVKAGGMYSLIFSMFGFKKN